jgi:hypothetical protein
LGALAAIVGAGAGALITRFEEEEAAFGEAATKTRETGNELTKDTGDPGTRVATETLDALMAIASAHGLHADRLVGEVIADLRAAT